MIIILSTGGYVWVAQKTPVEYVDENGETQTCTDYTTANYAGFAWSGWIVVHEDVYLDGRVETEGDVHLILEDGKTIGIRGGIHVSEAGSIEIFGQAECTGTLNADLNPTDFQFFFIELGVSKASAIGSNEWNSVAESNGPIVINGGVINATGFNAPGIGVANGNYPSGDITINGGVVTAAGKNNLAAGIGSGWGGPRVENTGKITINGGEVHATGLVGIGDGSSGGEIVTINGGVVEADGIGTRGDGTFGVPTTINGGVVTIHAAGGSLGGVTGGSPSVNNRVTFTVNGGQLIPDVPIGSAASDIFLGWTNETDFIQVPSYTGVVTLTDDWAVDGSDETFAAGAVSDNSTLSNKKLIPLAVSSQKAFVHIRLENCCEEQLSFRDGLPVTTKKDAAYHGFGMKSMRKITEKYDGTLTAALKDGWFELRILLPIPVDHR